MSLVRDWEDVSVAALVCGPASLSEPSADASTAEPIAIIHECQWLVDSLAPSMRPSTGGRVTEAGVTIIVL